MQDLSIEIFQFCIGYYLDTVGENYKAIGGNELKEVYIVKQLELELEDPFTGNCK